MKKNGIILFITLIFVMLISFALTISINNLNEIKANNNKNLFIYQSTILINDFIKLIKNNKDLKNIKNSKDLKEYLSYFKYIVFDISNYHIIINTELSSNKFNLNQLNNKNINILKEYLNKNNINLIYLNILKDIFKKNKNNTEIIYNTSIYDNLNISKGYIYSKKEFKKINSFYLNYYNDLNIQNINYNLFNFKDNNVKIDLNQLDENGWKFLFDLNQEEALKLVSNENYNSISDLKLNKKEIKILKNIKYSFFEPIYTFNIKIKNKNNLIKVIFDYNLKNKKVINVKYIY
jgi:hypothetical protein